MSFFKEILQGLTDLFFPQYCLHCGQMLLPEEKFLCIECNLDISTVTIQNPKNNSITKLFWGIIPLESAFAFMRFVPHSPSQTILHELKYKRNKDIGIYFGQNMAYSMIEKNFPMDFDLILPVPLHPKKLKIRGYNQAEVIARAISDVLNKKIETKAVVRKRFNLTQTRKSKEERWENVKNLFQIVSDKQLKNKHILLVDDVITTGATIEALAEILIKIPNVKISAAFLAMAQDI